jgi:CheY-like chemotaxis protein
LRTWLGELGYTVAAEAARMDEALEATKHADFDLAILDANLTLKKPFQMDGLKRMLQSALDSRSQ